MVLAVTPQIKKLKRYLWLLTVMVIILTGMVAAGLLWLSRLASAKIISAERINIINADGTAALVLSSAAKQHPGRMDGKDLPDRKRPAGILFFNNEGDECGGIVAGGNTKEAGMSFTMDQYKNDQILVLDYEQQNNRPDKNRSYGLTLNDRDEYSLLQQMHYFDSLKRLKDTAAVNAGVRKFRIANHVAKRLFLGRQPEGNVGLFLRDSKGRVRLRMYIDKQDNPVIESVDILGNVHQAYL